MLKPVVHAVAEEPEAVLILPGDVLMSVACVITKAMCIYLWTALLPEPCSYTRPKLQARDLAEAAPALS